MTSNRIPHWAALAITTAAAGLSPGGAHAYKAYATAAVAQVNFKPGVVDYGQQLTAAAQATATLPNIFEQTATSADLAQGQVHVRQEQRATGASGALQSFGQAYIADSFTHLSALSPFNWTSNTQARFDIHIDGVESLVGDLGQMVNVGKVLLMIYKPGTLDGALLAAVQRLDAGVDVKYPWAVQRFTHGVHQRGPHPRRASALVDTFERTAQHVFADDFVHPQRLCRHRITAQRGDVRITPMPSQQAQHQRAQHVAFVGCVAAAVAQRALRHPALEHAGSGQELRKEDQLAVRRGRRTPVPAHVHASAQSVHHLRRIAAVGAFGKRHPLLAF